MLRQIIWHKRHVFRACRLAENEGARARVSPHVNGDSATQVRKRKSGLAIAPVSGTQQRVQGAVIADGLEGTIAKMPIYRRESAGEKPDLTHKLITHFITPKTSYIPVSKTYQ